MNLTTPFLGPVLAATLAVTSATATPAQAGDRDAAKVLLGIAALSVLGAAIADSKSHAHAAPVHRAPSVTIHRHVAPKPKVVKRLPVGCRVKLRVQGKQRTVYSQTCLQRHVRHASALPRSCARTVVAFGKRQNVFYRNCLRQKGWHD